MGSEHACLTNKDWDAECWGYNFWGQVGLPSSSGLNISQPNRITFPPGKHLVLKIVAGRAHTCAIVDESANNVAKKVYCWGSNEFGQLGDDGNHAVSSSPVAVDFSATDNPPFFSIKRIVDLAAGADHTCAVLEIIGAAFLVNQEIWCWGKNDQFQLALPGVPAAFVSKPTVKSAFVGNEISHDFFVSGADGDSTHTQVASIAAGSHHTCVNLIRADTSVLWDFPNFGTLGSSPTTFCWGRNVELQLAYNGFRPVGATLHNFDPPNHVQQINDAQVAGHFSLDSSGSTINRGIEIFSPRLFAGSEVSCAVASPSGVPQCWGNNQFQQVTSDSSIASTRGVFQNSIGEIEELAIGKNHLCGTRSSIQHQVVCKGGNSSGQLGIGVADAAVYPAPQDVQKEDGTPLTGMVEIDAGDFFTCATDGQKVYCWGENTRGQIGASPSVVPVTKAHLLRGTVTLAPASPTIGNCFPFGMGSPTGGGSTLPWMPFGGFVYKNVPPFDVKIGDTIAFDAGAVNDAAIQLEIALAASTVNGGNVPAGAFLKVVSNTQTPTDPDGDTTVGNYELQFTAEAPFSFPGGGLLVRFSNPSTSYQADNTCTQVLVKADSTDASGFFVERLLRDTDGVPPWDETDSTSIGAFRFIPQ